MLVRELHEIEFTSICNLACVYCPHPTLQRAKAHMDSATFMLTLGHLQYLCAKGTQGEVSLTGIGETTLHPNFMAMASAVRRSIRDRKLVMSTNGLTMTVELARFLAEIKCDVYVSLHRPELAGRALRLLRDNGCRHGHNKAFADSALDWAGQVDWYVSAPKTVCQYLKNGWAAVRQDGSVNTCCMDAHGLYPIGCVEQDVGTLTTGPTKLCAGCNLIVPEEYKQEELMHG